MLEKQNEKLSSLGVEPKPQCIRCYAMHIYYIFSALYIKKIYFGLQNWGGSVL